MSHSDKEKAARRVRYASHPTLNIAAAKEYYRSHLHDQKCAMKNRYTRCRASTLQMRQRAYYNDTKSRKAAVLVRRAAQCMQKKAKRESPRALYSLSEPSQYTRELYVKTMKDNIDASLKEKLVNTFYSCRCDVEKTNSESMANAVLSMAARRVLQAALKIRKEQAGELIKSARSIDVLQIPDESDWERCHTATSEPYFYDQSYTQVKRDGPICIDGKGICYIAKEVGERKNDAGRPKNWNCTSECKVLTVEECKRIVNLKAIFQERMPSLRQALEDSDSGCNYGHYSIPWEIIAAKHDKLEVASDDSKQPEDSKPVSNGTLSEDSKPADVPTNDRVRNNRRPSAIFRVNRPSKQAVARSFCPDNPAPSAIGVVQIWRTRSRACAWHSTSLPNIPGFMHSSSVSSRLADS